MRVRGHLFGCALGTALFVGAPSLRAEASDASGAAAASEPPPSSTDRPVEERFAEARALYLEDECAAALPLFEGVYAETQSSNALLYVARCQRALGAWDAAYDSLRRTIGRAEEQAALDPKYEGTRDAAKSELEQVSARVALVTVVLTSDAPGVRVRIGARELRAEEVGTPVAVMPGMLRVEATPRDGDTVHRDVSVDAGASRTVALALNEKSAIEKKPEAPPADGDPGRGLRYAGIGGLALGAAGVTGFAIFGTLASSRYDELEDDCGGARCPADRQSDVDTGRTYQTVANVGLAVGIVGLAAGTTLVVLGWPKDDEGGSVALGVSPSAVTLRGVF